MHSSSCEGFSWLWVSRGRRGSAVMAAQNASIGNVITSASHSICSYPRAPITLLQAIVLVEHQSTHFNALSALLILCARNMESSMWHTSRTPILLRIKALDKYHLLGAEVRLVEPPVQHVSPLFIEQSNIEIADLPVRWIMFDRVSLAPASRVDEFGDDQ